jgi:phosphate-selective porin
MRYDALRFDDGSDIAPASHAWTAALNYQPRSWVRLMANGIVDHYGERAHIPERPDRGYFTLLARLQLVVP